MIDFDTFAPLIYPYCQGAAEPLVNTCLIQAAQEFCERTRLWRYHDEFDIVGNQCDPIFAPANAVIHEIEHVSFNGLDLDPESPEWLDLHQKGWRLATLTGAPRYFTQLAPDSLMLVPIGAGHVAIDLYLKPSDDADQFPDFLGNQYRRVMAKGALGRILAIPKQAFFDAQYGMACTMEFQAEIDKLTGKNSIGQQRAKPRARSRYY